MIRTQHSYKVIAMALLVLFSFAACTCKPKDSQDSNNSGLESARGPVNLAIWSNYVSPEMLKKFTESTGIQVNVSNYSSNEELLAKMQAGGSGIDVAVPSDYMVSIMISLQLLRALNREKLTNFGGLDPDFLGKTYDPTNRYSVPYGWTVTGIATNTELTKNPVTSWAALLAREDLKGKISLLDDSREALGAVLRTQGKSINSVDTQSLTDAKIALSKVKSRIKAFTSEPLDMLVNGDLAASQMYSSDALQARRNTKNRVQFEIPEEGGTLAIDNVVVPLNAPNPTAAFELVNFLISNEANLSFVTTVLAGPVVKGTKSLLPAELQADTGLFPSAEKLAKCEMIQDIGEASEAWDRIWTEVKVSY